MALGPAEVYSSVDADTVLTVLTHKITKAVRTQVRCTIDVYACFKGFCSCCTMCVPAFKRWCLMAPRLLRQAADRKCLRLTPAW